jgi:predicted esterase
MPCDCFGPEGAEKRVVYLHGLDTRGPSWIELQNRARLRAVAELLHIRIALPRAGGAWPQHGSEEIQRSFAMIESQANTCFRSPARFGLIGFSNGGNFANALFLRCSAGNPAWIVSVGSEGGVPRDSAPLSTCGEIRLIAGRHDPAFASSRGLARQLARRGADVRFIEHPGLHELPFEQTLAVVADLSSTNEAGEVRQFALVQVLFSVAGLLIISIFGLVLALRSPSLSINRFAVAALLLSCSFAAAVGSEPGILFYSLQGTATFVLCLAIAVSGLLGRFGSRSLAAFGFWSAIFCAAAAAGWQLGVAPVIATFVVRN